MSNTQADACIVYRRSRFWPSAFSLLLAIPCTVLPWLGSPRVSADEWPGWRGADRSDVSTETGLMQQWPQGGPPRLWLYRDAGLGYSGPAIVRGKLITMGSKNGVSMLYALSAETGEELWATSLGETYTNGWGDGPRGTPTVDGNRVFALSGNGDLICVSTEDGKLIWQVQLVDDFHGKIPRWGYSESPLADGDQVVVTPGSASSAVVALDVRDGSVRWESEFAKPAQYASIVPVDLDGTRHYIQLFEQEVVGIDSRSGKTLWEMAFPGSIAVIPTPVVRRDKVYVSAGYGTGCMMVQFSKNGAEEIYRNKVMKNHHGGVILVGDRLFGHSDKTGWVCQDFESGKRLWRERKALEKGAIAYADDRLYCVGEDSGKVKLIEASDQAWTEAGSFLLEPQSEKRKSNGRIWTHPVISDGRLFLRDQDLIYCYDIRADHG